MSNEIEKNEPTTESPLAKIEAKAEPKTLQVNFAGSLSADSFATLHKPSKGAINRHNAPEEKDLAKMLGEFKWGDPKAVQVAFDLDPMSPVEMSGIFYSKPPTLVPDIVLQRIAMQDSLVASIITARANHLRSFGRPQKDRHSIGFAVQVRPEVEVFLKNNPQRDKIMADIQKRISRAKKLLATCGSTDGIISQKEREAADLSRFFYEATRQYCTLGRVAIEVVWTKDNKFHRFRVRDAATIAPVMPNYQTKAVAVYRQMGEKRMENMYHGLELLANPVSEEVYQYVQHMNGHIVTAFTAKEMIHVNFYPSPDVKLLGYPVTPIDTAIAEVTTHLNITSHNKLFFQAGRAAKGFVVIQSDDADEELVQNIRQQMQANINSVQNAWRTPVFGIGVQDKVSWMQTESGGRDGEFEFLSEANARAIMAAFQISPEELAGYAHMSKGTNSQALAESNQEYLLTAHRDVGLRPMVSNWEDLMNRHILPLIDPNLSQIAEFRMLGLDAENREKEAISLGQDAPLHMTYDEIMQRVEKPEIGAAFCGTIPFNPTLQAIWDKYLTVGQIQEHFMGVKGASQDPNLNYYRDPFYFQHRQLTLQEQQLQMQQQQMQQQAQMQQQGGQGQPEQGGGQGGQGGKGQEDKSAESSSKAMTEGGDQAREMSSQIQGAQQQMA